LKENKNGFYNIVKNKDKWIFTTQYKMSWL
jgi:hypothetical protein